MLATPVNPGERPNHEGHESTDAGDANNVWPGIGVIVNVLAHDWHRRLLPSYAGDFLKGALLLLMR